MASFDVSQYETVEQRIKRFTAEHPDGRIITEDLTTLQDRAVSTWRVKTTIYLNREDQLLGLPKATGHAFEVDGAGMANKTSAWENAETSSIGRALANMAMSGNKRTSREEMNKVASGVTPAPVDWIRVAEDLAWKKDLDGLIALYNKMVAAKAPEDLIEKVKQIGNDTRGSANSAV